MRVGEGGKEGFARVEIFYKRPAHTMQKAENFSEAVNHVAAGGVSCGSDFWRMPEGSEQSLL